MTGHHATVWNGMTLDCEYHGEKYRPATRLHPEEGGDFDVIEAINAEGCDIIDLLTQAAQKDLSAHVLEELSNDAL